MKQPEIQVDPADTLFFPRVVAGTAHRAPLVLRNVGRASLEVSGVTLGLGADSPFAVDDAVSFPLSIAPGESHILTVVYTPSVGSGGEADVDTLLIESDDPAPARARWSVILRSANNGPVLSIVPSEVDFSLVQGHRGPVTMTVINSGTEPTSVQEVLLEGGPEFHLAPVSGLPHTLAVGESFDVQVSCSAVDASDVSATTGIATLVAQPVDPAHQAGSATLYGPPMANAGPDRDTVPLPREPSFLNGRSSRSLGGAISKYQWVLVDAPVGSETAEAFNAGLPQTPDYVDAPSCPADQTLVPEPCFIPDVPGVYRFELRVTDVRPVCALADPAAACSGDEACCSFSCTSGTCGGAAGEGLCREGGGCVIEGVNVDSVEVRALGQGLLVFLTWDGTADLDLHLVDDLGGRCVSGEEPCRLDGQCGGAGTCDLGDRRWRGPADCYWENPQPDWGAPRQDNGVSCTTSFDCEDDPQYPDCIGPAGSGMCTDTLDDPRLAKDESTAFGPEVIRLRTPIHAPGPPNVYHVGVHYFPDPLVNDPREATVQVYYEGIELFPEGLPAQPLSRTLDNEPNTDTSFWYAGWIVVSPGDATWIANPAATYNVQGTSWPALADPP